MIMASEYVADGVYRVSGMKTQMKDGAWSSDPGMYLVADQTKLASIEGATPGDRAFTAGYRKVWQLAADGTTWVEMPGKSFTVNAVPVSALTLGGGWVDLAMTADCDEILAAASSGRCVINLQYDNYTKVVCMQRETVQYPNLTPQVFFTGMFLDNAMYIINVMITATDAQAAVIGTVPIST